MIENLKVLLKMGYHGVFEKLLLFTYVTRIDLQHNTYANDREEDEDAEWKLANLYAGMAPTNAGTRTYGARRMMNAISLCVVCFFIRLFTHCVIFKLT